MEYEQYNKAYPKLHYDEPPSALNGYGWHGNGYGWQLDPRKYNPKSLDEGDGAGSEDGSADEVEEQEITVQKVEQSHSFFGEPGSGIRHTGGIQDFYELRDYHLSERSLFEDPQFPADDSSVYFSHRPHQRIEWRRPMEISHDPKLFVEGFSRFDVQQGELGDCWLLAAVANLTMYQRLFFQVVPDDQSFTDKYAGIFHFRFWQYGRWIDIVIDDRLPTRNGQLLFLRSTDDNEFWSALLEKAYAKLYGSYESLKGGSTCEAMEDFTGGVTEMYELNAAPSDLFKIMVKAFERGSLMGCSIEPDPNELEARTQDGLVKGHAYSVTKVKFVDIRTPNTSGKIPLLRLRNPWGDDTEWNGPWSDSSPEWRFIPDEEKGDMGLNFDSDGEFWMSYKDFVNKFDRIEMCNLNPDSTEGQDKKWEVSYFEGSWIRGVTAGGCRNFLDTFASNPQYRITLTQPDDEENDGKCTVLVALMQKNRRSKRKLGLEELSVGFVVYYIRNPESAPRPLDKHFFKHNAIIARCPSYINLREVTCRFRLYPGTYCIIPSTFDPNEEGEFLLRVFSEHQSNMEENDTDVGLVETQKSREKEGLKMDSPIMREFMKMAGENQEINARQLCGLLSNYLQDDNDMQRRRLDQVESAQTNPQDDAERIITTILSLLCMTVCKSDQMNDIIPKTEETSLIRSAHNDGKRNSVVFSPEVCKSLMALYDVDFSGKLGVSEFQALWRDTNDWISVFRRFDKDASKTLSGFELREALVSAGYSVNNHTLNLLMIRYGDNGVLSLEDFIISVVKLHHMIQSFKKHSEQNANEAKYTLHSFLDDTIYS